MQPLPPDDARTDLELVADVNGGDPSAFEVLYRRHRDWVASLAYRFTGHRDDALEVLQETFAYLLSRFPGFRLTARMTTYLYPVVRNLAIDCRRKKRRFQGADAPLEGIPAPAPSEPSALASVLEGLPPGHREVLVMRFVDGMPLEEIAQALGIPSGTVKSRLHNALAALRADGRTRSYFER